MNIDREVIESVVMLLNLALGAEENPFGVFHNEATDMVGTLELLLMANWKEELA